MSVTIVLILAIVLIVGNLYLRLHALPEQMAHRANLVQFQVVAVLALLALFTHNHIFWIAALLLALVRIPDIVTPLKSIARSLVRMAGHRTAVRETVAHDPQREPEAAHAMQPAHPAERAAAHDGT